MSLIQEEMLLLLLARISVGTRDDVRIDPNAFLVCVLSGNVRLLNCQTGDG